MLGEGRPLGPIDDDDIPNEINTETFNKLQMPRGRMVLECFGWMVRMLVLRLFPQSQACLCKLSRI